MQPFHVRCACPRGHAACERLTRLSVALVVLLIGLARAPCAAAPPPMEGNLYFLGIAIDAHPDKGKPISDYNWMVEYVGKALSKNSATLYRRMESKLVLDQHATRQGILEGLAWIKRKMTPRDVAIIYMESHGITDGKKGFSMSGAGQTSVYGAEIKYALGGVPGRVVLFVDACGAGGILSKHPMDRYDVPQHVVVISACRAKESAWGELLGGVMEALYGKGDRDRDGVVTLDELMRHVARRVTEFSPTQHPVETARNQAGFDLSLPLVTVSPSLVTVDSRSAIVMETRPNKSLVYFPGKWISDNAWVANDSLRRVSTALDAEALAAVTLDVLEGDYRRSPAPENPWHEGSLKIESRPKGTMRWTNKAGKSWVLRLGPKNHRLQIGPDCPYYVANKPNPIEIVLRRGVDGRALSKVDGFTFQSDLYKRLDHNAATGTSINGAAP
jgi:Caspase domain